MKNGFYNFNDLQTNVKSDNVQTQINNNYIENK